MDYLIFTERVIYYVLAVTQFISSTTASQIACSKDPKVIKFIDGNKYDCCRGNQEIRQVGKKCCFGAGQFYFEQYSFCCDGKVFAKNESHSSSCCHNQVINDATHICCDEKILPLPTGVSRMQTSCCGDKAYDMHKKFCCINTLSDRIKGLRCCGNKVIDTGTSWCDRGKETPRYFTTCGNQTIDIRRNSCCRGTVNDFPLTDPLNMKIANKYHGCCGDKAYNKRNETCCNPGNIIPNLPNVQCCGMSGFINKKSELCCNGVRHEKKEGFSCCGNQTYDTRIRGCCFNTIYLNSTQKCCNVKIHPKDTKCCGSESLTDDKLCCKNSRTLTKEREDDNECCVKYYRQTIQMVPFNNATKGCHNGKLYTKSEEEPCGSRFYNPKKEICCGVSIYAIPRGQNLSCCGVKAFNEDKQKCCFNVLLEASSRNDKCCGITKTVKQNEDCGPQKIRIPSKVPRAVPTESSTNNSNTASQLNFTLWFFVVIVEIIRNIMSYQ